MKKAVLKSVLAVALVLMVLWQVMQFHQTEKHQVIIRNDLHSHEDDLPFENTTDHNSLDMGAVSRLVAVVGMNYNGQSLALNGLKRPYVLLLPHYMSPPVNTMKVLPVDDHAPLIEQVKLLLKNAGSINGTFGVQKENPASSPCSITRYNRTVLVQNTGPALSPGLPGLQLCNYTDGPLLLSRRAFQSISWPREFCQLSFMSFFLSLGTELTLVKDLNAKFTQGTYFKDRGIRSASQGFPEYAQFGREHDIVRFIYEDRIEWTQCIAHWSLCKETPLTWTPDIINMSMPVCCSETLDTLLRDIVSALEHLSVTYRVVFGTLLGAVRSQAIIPWTPDIDIGIKENLFHESFFNNMQAFLGPRYWTGLSFVDTYRAHPLYPPTVRGNLTDWVRHTRGVFFTEEALQAIDMLADQVSTDWTRRCYVDFYPSPQGWLNGLSHVTINGREYLTVLQIETTLENWYGKDYMKPILEKEWVGMSNKGHTK